MPEPTLPIALNEHSRISIRKQLCEQLIDLITSLQIMPGQMLPSSRELASSLGISRATAVRAYQDLTARGYIETIEGVGTFVCKRLTIAIKEEDSSVSVKLSRYAHHLMMFKTDRLTPHDFTELNHGTSPIELLPLNQWKSAVNKAQQFFKSDLQEIDFGIEPFGHLPLRRAIAGFVKRSSMIDCLAENLLTCSSSVYLLELVAELLIDPGTSVAFPEPGPLYARDIFNKLGANLIAVVVDDQGMRIDELISLKKPPEILYINSSHQEPSGASLSMERRKELLSWAERNSIVIIEDDFDSQYRFKGTRQPPLRALSTDANVIYLSSFWRTLFPLINVSYMVVPEIMTPFLKQSWYLTQGGFHTHFPIFEQKGLEILLEEGEYEKHLQKCNAILADRWRNCTYQLTLVFGKSVELSSESSSYHVFLKFLHKDLDESRILKAASEVDLAILSARDNYMIDKSKNAFLIPFAYMEKSELAERIAKFKRELENS